MRVLVTSRPAHPVPMEMLPTIFQLFSAWRERHRASMESFYFFASGGGGCGVFNTPDETALAQIIIEYPFGPFSDVKTEPIVADGDVGIKMFGAFLQQMAAMQGQ